MVKVSEHVENSLKFYDLGSREYEEGRIKGDLIKMREGCEKVFHAYVEAVNALIQKYGLPEPDSHEERWRVLNEKREKELIEIGDRAFLYLHVFGYYKSTIRPEVEETIKDVDKAIKYVKGKVAK
jgi:hypothetical protein